MFDAHKDDKTSTGFETFERMESEVRSYARSFPAVFTSARGSRITDKSGRSYVDFLSGCSTLNYGHNHPKMKEALVDYLMQDGVAHTMDMYSVAKAQFLEAFDKHILRPRGMKYRLQFPGPTGANAVEAAIKLARKVTGRTNVIAFTNGFHGCTLGALALTGNGHHRGGSGVPLTNVTRMPYDQYFGEGVDTAAQIEKMIKDASGGVDAPAAIILETIQGEGGLNAASAKWLQKIEKIARDCGALLIVDDIQAGCGRSGSFFSFEEMGIQPDIVTMAKSLSGMGLPMALVLLKPELDEWKPGEHNGTFRGNCHAFITARVAIEEFWANDDFEDELKRKAKTIRTRLDGFAKAFPSDINRVKGRGVMLGIEVADAETTSAIVKESFSRGLIIETAGPDDEVVKLLTPLNISDEDLEAGLAILGDALQAVYADAGANLQAAE